MLTKSRVAQLCFMLAVLIGLFVWRTYDEDKNVQKINQEESSPGLSLLRCDYSQACEFITEQGTFLLRVKNTPIQAEEWIDFELSMPAENIEVSKAQIIGKTMFMGRIPVKFKASGDMEYSGRGIVGSCTTHEMIWELQITVKKGDVSELLSFDFIVKK